jgi:hypothetical protein
VTGRWFSAGPLVSSTNKTDHHDKIEILLKVALNTIKKQQTISLVKNLPLVQGKQILLADTIGVKSCLVNDRVVWSKSPPLGNIK